MEKILVDTSAVFALLNRNGRRHNEAKEILLVMARKKYTPVLTNFIVAEIYALLLTKLGAHYARLWLRNNSWPVERVIKYDESRAREIIFQYTDKDFSYTDAVSFAVMERLEIRTAFTFDKHFEQFGINVLRAEA